MQLVNAAATFALMIVVLTVVEFRESRMLGDASPVRLTAEAVNMTGLGPASSTTVDINIERWSSEGERDRLAATFHARGPEQLAGTLQGLKRVGYLRLPSLLGYDLHFARMLPLAEGGRRIIIATDRRIGLADSRSESRAMECPFTLIEIRLKPDGTGEGKMALAARWSMNQPLGTMELERYANEPVSLQNVKVEPR